MGCCQQEAGNEIHLWLVVLPPTLPPLSLVLSCRNQVMLRGAAKLPHSVPYKPLEWKEEVCKLVWEKSSCLGKEGCGCHSC